MAGEKLRALLRQRAHDLGKTVETIAAEAGLARTYLYKLSSGGTMSPSVNTLVRLAAALEVSPVALFRQYANLEAATTQRARRWSGVSLSTGIFLKEDAIAFNGDITIPDHFVVRGGEGFRKMWEVQNIGSVPWKGRKLRRVDEQFVISRFDIRGIHEPLLQAHLLSLNHEVRIPDTPPGCCVHLHVDFVAPRANCSVASIWRVHDRDDNPIYDHSFFLRAIVMVIDQ